MPQKPQIVLNSCIRCEDLIEQEPTGRWVHVDKTRDTHKAYPNVHSQSIILPKLAEEETPNRFIEDLKWCAKNPLSWLTLFMIFMFVAMFTYIVFTVE
jgi:hypothetical protein